jgi:hypothetical protein
VAEGNLPGSALALKIRVEDVYTQKLRTWMRLHEKGGRRHEMLCHHNHEADWMFV